MEHGLGPGPVRIWRQLEDRSQISRAIGKVIRHPIKIALPVKSQTALWVSVNALREGIEDLQAPFSLRWTSRVQRWALLSAAEALSAGFRPSRAGDHRFVSHRVLRTDLRCCLGNSHIYLCCGGVEHSLAAYIAVRHGWCNISITLI